MIRFLHFVPGTYFLLGLLEVISVQFSVMVAPAIRYGLQDTNRFDHAWLYFPTAMLFALVMFLSIAMIEPILKSSSIMCPTLRKFTRFCAGRCSSRSSTAARRPDADGQRSGVGTRRTQSRAVVPRSGPTYHPKQASSVAETLKVPGKQRR